MKAWDTKRGEKALSWIGMPRYSEWALEADAEHDVWLSCVRDVARQWLDRRKWRVVKSPWSKGPRYDVEQADQSDWRFRDRYRTHDQALVAAILMAKEASDGK